MPVVVEDLDNGLGVLIRVGGVVGEEEYFAALKKHLTQDLEKFSKYRYSISDYSEAEEIDFSTQKVEELVWLCKDVAKSARSIVVAVVSDDDYIFGMSRMFEMLMEATGWEIIVGRSIEEARQLIVEKLKDKFNIVGVEFEGESIKL